MRIKKTESGERVENDRSTDAGMAGLLLETCVINFSTAARRLSATC